MATSFVNTNPQFTINTGGNFSPNAGGEIEFFDVGTTGDSNRKDTYNTPTPSDPPVTSEKNPNPVPLDSYGRPSVPIFLIGSYNTVIRDSAGNQIETKDNVAGSGADGIASLIVDNVAALRLVDTTLYTYATILGTSTTADGGQGSFYYDSGSAAADNGTTIIEPDVGAGRWLILGVDTIGLVDSAVTTAKLADSSVTEPKLGDQSVTSGKFGWLPLRSVDGLEVTNNSGDSDHDIDIATGFIADSTQAYVMNLTGSLTKEIDATFVVGSGGGRSNNGSTAALTADTFYGVFLISKSTDPTDCDVIFATTQANALADTVAVAAGFDIARRIFGFVTDSSANIPSYFKNGDGEYLYSAPKSTSITDQTSRQNVTVPVPVGQVGIFNYHLRTENTTQVYAILLTKDQDDVDPGSSTSFSIFADGEPGQGGTDSAVLNLKVDSSRQITNRASASDANTSMWLHTLGWKDDLTVLNL